LSPESDSARFNLDGNRSTRTSRSCLACLHRAHCRRPEHFRWLQQRCRFTRLVYARTNPHHRFPSFQLIRTVLALLAIFRPLDQSFRHKNSEQIARFDARLPEQVWHLVLLTLPAFFLCNATSEPQLSSCSIECAFRCFHAKSKGQLLSPNLPPPRVHLL
jgi:hypothetical protein